MPIQSRICARLTRANDVAALEVSGKIFEIPAIAGQTVETQYRGRPVGLAFVYSGIEAQPVVTVPEYFLVRCGQDRSSQVNVSASSQIPEAGANAAKLRIKLSTIPFELPISRSWVSTFN